MVSKNAGDIMSADCVCPSFDNCFDLTFGSSALLHHGVAPSVPMYVPRTNAQVHIRHAEYFFMLSFAAPALSSGTDVAISTQRVAPQQASFSDGGHA
jgi:hypothetical protein